MIEQKFEVFLGEDRLATDMTLEDALLFVEALYKKYSRQNLEITVKKAKGEQGGKEK